jgi:two-component system OmpR family sensor kinase
VGVDEELPESIRAGDETTRLVAAICHEIGNMVAAIRLHAHLLDEDLAPVQLAVASVEIDDLAGRMSALLALVRPLMNRGEALGSEVRPAAILAAVQQALDDQGGRGMSLSVDCAPELPLVSADPDVIHHLLLTLVFDAVEWAEHKGEVQVSAREVADTVVFEVADDGREDDQLLDWREQTLRGRSLTCAVADFIARKHGGRLEVDREGDRTRVLLRVPAARSS